MKRLRTSIYVLFIMALMASKLNASDLGDSDSYNLARQSVDIAREFKYRADHSYRLVSEEEAKDNNDSKSCIHCPKHMELTKQINNVIAEMAKNPALSAVELPPEINKLKFLYYTQLTHDQNGVIRCQRFNDFNPDLKPTKLDGQFQLLLEDAFKFKSVSALQYINPNVDEVVYYYRGEGDKKDVIVQAIMSKSRAKFRYFKYTPKGDEKNPYNLPGMDLNMAPRKELTATQKMEFSDVIDRQVKDEASLSIKTNIAGSNGRIPLPKDIHLIKASVVKAINENINLNATTDTSLRGNRSEVKLKNGVDDLLLVSFDTGVNGQTEKSVSIPYTIRTLDSLPAISGSVTKSNRGQNLDLSMSGSEQVLVMSVGRSDGSTSTSVKHTTMLSSKPNSNIMMILEVNHDREKKTRIFYTLAGNFK